MNSFASLMNMGHTIDGIETEGPHLGQLPDPGNVCVAETEIHIIGDIVVEIDADS